MARIIIKDLPKEIKISKEEMKMTFGGLLSAKAGGRTTVILSDIRSSFLRRDNPFGGGIYLK